MTSTFPDSGIEGVAGNGAAAFRAMTFNMRWETTDDKDREDADGRGRDCQWTARKELFFSVIIRNLPDLLGVQEVMPNQMKDLKEMLGNLGYTCYGQARDGECSEGLFLAARTPVWHVRETGTFWIGVDKPDVPGSKAPGAQFPRIAIWASLEMVASGRKLLFVNTHFDHPASKQAEDNRTKSAEQIAHFVKERGIPAVTTLDSNAEPGASAHSKFLAMGLTDSWAECHPNQTLDRPTTFHLFKGPRFRVPGAWTQSSAPEALGPGGRKTCHIDWCLHTSDLRALACEIDYTDGEIGKAPPSDHFPVITCLRFE